MIFGKIKSMDLENIPITKLIPQRTPFVLVDSVIFSTPTKTITEFNIKEDTIFSKDGFFREPGMIENIAQSVAAGRGLEGSKENLTPKIGYIGSIKDLKIYFFPKTNTKIKTEIEIQNQVLNFTAVAGKIYSNNEVAAECNLVIAVSQS